MTRLGPAQSVRGTRHVVARSDLAGTPQPGCRPHSLSAPGPAASRGLSSSGGGAVVTVISGARAAARSNRRCLRVAPPPTR